MSDEAIKVNTEESIGSLESNAGNVIDSVSNTEGAIKYSNVANESLYADGTIDVKSNAANELSYADSVIDFVYNAEGAIDVEYNAEGAIGSGGSDVGKYIWAVGDNKLERMYGTTQGTTVCNSGDSNKRLLLPRSIVEDCKNFHYCY